MVYPMSEYRSAYNRERVDVLIARSRDSKSIRVIELCVEGKDDIEFYTKWTNSIQKDFSSTIFRVEKVENIVGTYSNIDKSVGMCGIVEQMAQQDNGKKDRVFIRDRDLLKDHELIRIDNLFYTDYPAIESYSFTKELFIKINEYAYLGRYKDIDTRYQYALNFLVSMYFMRIFNQGDGSTVKREVESLRKKYKSYFKDGHFTIMDCYSHSDNRIKDNVNNILDQAREGRIDTRQYIYSHDTEFILNFIFSTDKDLLKSIHCASQSGKYIVGWMLDRFISDGLWKKEKMFQSIKKYII